MSATKRPPEEIESPGYGFRPDELPFYTSDAHGLLESVVAAIRHSLDKSLAHHADTAAGYFISLLVQASQRLGRGLRETGPGVREDALRAALPKLEKAAQIRGSPDGIDRFTEQLAGDVNAPVGKHLHAASEIIDWCIAGCRASLAELEEEATPRKNGAVDDAPEDEYSEEVVRLARLALAASEVAVRSVPETLERRRCACIRLEAEVEDAVDDAFEALGVEETDVFYSHVRERAAEVLEHDSSGEGESRE